MHSKKVEKRKERLLLFCPKPVVASLLNVSEAPLAAGMKSADVTAVEGVVPFFLKR